MIAPLDFQLLDAPDLLPIDGLALVLAERVRQIQKFGHTPQADAQVHPSQLFDATRRYAKATAEDINCGAPRDTQLRHAVLATAMWLALVDRLMLTEPPLSPSPTALI